MYANGELTFNIDKLRDFLMSEREKSLSESEWKFRMRGYGYKLDRTDDGVKVARLPQNQLVATLDI